MAEYWLRLSRLVILVQFALIGLHASAYAQQLQPVQSTLQRLIAAGFLAFVGRLTWFFAGSIIFGIVLVFGSAQIVSFFQSAVGGGGGG